MPASSSTISSKIYRSVPPTSYIEFSCNSHMLAVLLTLDGNVNLATISQQTGLPLETVSTTIEQLADLNLVVATNNGNDLLDDVVLVDIMSNLAMAIGPLAEVVFDETIQDLGYQRDSFPAAKLADLILALSKEIQRDDKKREFKMKMMDMIKKQKKV